MAELTDDEILAELGLDVTTAVTSTYTPVQERMIAGFEEIQQFVEIHGRVPQHGEQRDIFERLYAVRLDRLRSMPEARELLAEFDTGGILEAEADVATALDDVDDDEILAELGIELKDDSNIAHLKYVVPHHERQAAEEVARRKTCEDFNVFAPQFEEVRLGLANGTFETVRYGQVPDFEQGAFFIVDGLMAYVAEMEPLKEISHGKLDGRLRVIFSNGTESGMLYRSLQKSLYKDELGRRIQRKAIGGLFGDTWDEEDVASGTIYVLRSHSDHPFISEHRELVHKIGVTGGAVETRIANAKQEATFLLADVEIVATYRMAGLNRVKLEKILHRVLSAAQLELTIEDRFGNPVQPKEWFLVPLSVVDEVMEKIRDGSISELIYSPEVAKLVPAPVDIG